MDILPGTGDVKWVRVRSELRGLLQAVLQRLTACPPCAPSSSPSSWGYMPRWALETMYLDLCGACTCPSATWRSRTAAGTLLSGGPHGAGRPQVGVALYTLFLLFVPHSSFSHVSHINPNLFHENALQRC
mmetsp:Transcript_7674/g.10869  ORF Transcript_7674/g.10869 Transcript_7674/m.10869 type:complete len:130 (+) Transcript_7674:201-590(+)